MSKNRKIIAKNVRKRKIYFSILFACFAFLGLGFSNLVSNLNISGSIQVKRYIQNEGTVYSILENKSLEGTYARKYEGSHQDSFVSTGTKDIYYWYASDATAGETIKNMNNVIFAGHCWQMIRTTDTGGVKLIYNGEPENNKCLNTRGNHIGYTNYNSMYMSSGYYYGTEYEYNTSTRVFRLSGDLVKSDWNETTAPSLLGYYTCKSTSSNGTCNTLYLIDSYVNSSYAYAFFIGRDSHYSQFGVLPTNSYASSASSIAHVGYMYNAAYIGIGENRSNTFTIASNRTISTSEYYSDSVVYSDGYTLDNPTLISDLLDYNDLIGKYVSTSTGLTSSVYYVVGITDSTMYYRNLTNGDLDTSITMSSSYSESGGIYTLTSPVNVTFIDWYNSSDFSSYKGKYVCLGNNTSCSVLQHLYPSSNPSKTSYIYVDSTRVYSFAEDVSYENGLYTLIGDVQNIWDYYTTDNKGIIKTHHYTCLESGASCSSMNYYLFISGYYLYYIQYRDVESIADALDEMLHVDNVNTIESVLKKGVELWYKENLLQYDHLIEDVIFCNNRKIATLGSWNPNGGLVASYDYLYFDRSSTNLSCALTTDQFSTFNSLAPLSYKIGLITSPEIRMMGNSSVASTGNVYKTMSPYAYLSLNNRPSVRIIKSDGSIYDDDSSRTYGVRPVISLAPGVNYIVGDGSMANPYLVADGNNYVYSIINNSSVFHTPLYSASNISVQLYSDDYVATSFKLNGTLIEGDSFVMPAETVTITDIQYASRTHTISNTNPDVTVPSTGRYGNTITITPNSEDYIVSSFKMNGTLVEGSSFVMPLENVTLTDIILTKVRFSITVNDSTVTVPSIGRVGDTITITSNSDDNVVSSFKMNGTLVEGRSFVMPSENVTITDITKRPCVIVESAHNPYANNINNVVYYENTFTGATSLTVELTYQTESTNFDWIYLYDTSGSSTPYGNKKYGGSTENTETITINSNYLKIVFRTDSSNCNYYGFKAKIIPNYD